MSRAQYLIMKLDEALSPKTKKVLKYGAAAAGAAGVGYLAYKHGEDVWAHGVTGDHPSSPSPSSPKGGGSSVLKDWTPPGESPSASSTHGGEHKPEISPSGKEHSGDGATKTKHHIIGKLHKHLSHPRDHITKFSGGSPHPHSSPHSPEIIQKPTDFTTDKLLRG